MDAIDIVKNYLNGELSSESFQKEIYQNKGLECFLSEDIDVPPYTNLGSAYLYLIENDVLSPSGELNGKDLLSNFLTKKGISYIVNSDYKETYEILRKVQPSWIDLPNNYIKFIFELHKGKTGKELEKELKSYIDSEFQWLKKKPKWVQSPDWPIVNNKPLFFIDQVDISKIKHDTSWLYIFYNEEDKHYITIEQSM
ncbi:hypothetical protein AB1P82_000348 [Salmonella enterica subsp. enterica serovar Senftenberg]|uniref:hypothetical protein n=1 Tax=Salmonella enterica TaxID=28901 RepID=UPI0003BD765C|nr:hypothetical protein [Salmonella enterica]EBQ8936979.1 hypothetical protein [Salmonella enterica subsp. enterica serovar Rideau]EDV0663478.1 hypothetical protein [Salmonella enterica subsp. enterica serovar Mbandaka]HBC0131482.1 hypothetical protein [Salmonella enterica subsp. enterica serovar Westhampton]AZI92184.1 hypothetical protein EIL74_12865 [Salmonella enterica subsp. enterica serovar Senftenberg]EAM3030874.1 hypothetical protein [Salmonella enterica]